MKDAHLRVSDFVSVSAEDGYKHFAATYPELFQGILLHRISSYLGITPQSLNRIRRELANRTQLSLTIGSAHSLPLIQGISHHS